MKVLIGLKEFKYTPTFKATVSRCSILDGSQEATAHY